MMIIGLILLGVIAEVLVVAGMDPLHAWIGLIVVIVVALFASD